MAQALGAHDMSIDYRLPRYRWLFGVLLGVAAALVRASLQPVIGDQLPFLVAFPTTVIAAVVWGAGPSTVCALICAAAIASPAFPPYLTPANTIAQLGAFLLGSVGLAFVCGQLAQQRRADDRGLRPLPEGETAASQWLRAALWGAVLIPLVAFILIAWWGFARAQRDAEATVAHASELAYRQAHRTFAIAAEIAARADAATPIDDDDAHRRESEVHQRLADMASGLPSVVNLNIWDASGKPIARSDLFPVDAKASVADRDYFIAQREKAIPLDVSDVIIGRQTGKELMNATIRRRSKDGRFNGVVAVSLSPAFFRDFYESLGSEQPNLASFSLDRIDGQVLAHWPREPNARTRVPAGSPILESVRAGLRSGSVVLPEIDGRETRVAGFRRLDDYPLYVVAGVSRPAMFADWARFVALLAAILFPTAGGLIYVTWVALNRTRREALTALDLQAESRRRETAERGMLQSQKLETLAIVTGGVAHDFNNLLAILSTGLHIHQRRHPDISDEKQLQAMARAIQSGVRLTRQLLSFSRKQSLRPEHVELQSWLPGTEGLIRTTLGSSVAWSIEVDPATKPVRVDVGELELALINLVVNARLAMPQGGTLTIRAANAPAAANGQPMVSIAVADNGAGIPEALLGKVFEPFFTTRTQGAGSGLGLSQVLGMCVAAGGAARIESRIGEGTTVRMDLPASAEHPIADAPVPAPAIRLTGRVLLVEDNEDLAATAEMMLRDAGLDVVRRVNADAAWATLQGTDPLPDVVLSDIAMPGSMDGVALAFALRQRYPGLQTILTTGYAERHVEAIEGGLSVLSKPVAPEVLLEVLRSAIERARTLRTASR